MSSPAWFDRGIAMRGRADPGQMTWHYGRPERNGGQTLEDFGVWEISIWKLRLEDDSAVFLNHLPMCTGDMAEYASSD